MSVTRKDAANSNDAGFGNERICFEVPGVRNRVALFPILFCLGVWKKSAWRVSGSSFVYLFCF